MMSRAFNEPPAAPPAPEFPTEPGHRQAFEIRPASVVILETDQGRAAFIKLERIGKEYIHHYAVQLHPRIDTALGMVYLDPEDTVFDTVLAADFDFGTATGEHSGPRAGHAFENAKGHFIKVDEDPQSQKLYGFVECSTGIVRRRQERGIKAVYTQWSATASADGQTVSMEEVLLRFEGELKA